MSLHEKRLSEDDVKLSVFSGKLLTVEDQLDRLDPSLREIDDENGRGQIRREEGGRMQRCSCEINASKISLLEGDLAFNRILLKYASHALNGHTAEILSLKSEIQVAEERVRNNDLKFE